MMAAQEKETRKTPELILVGRCVTRLVRRLGEAKAHLDDDWGRMTEGDRGEVLARLDEIHLLTLAAAELRASIIAREGRGQKVRVQRRRRRRKRQGNEFQAILREAARRYVAA